MKRILIGGMHHESNSFNPIIANKQDFQIAYGEEIFERIRENDAMSGIVQTLKKHEYELLPTVFMRAVPNGEVDTDFYLEVLQEMMTRAQTYHDEKPLDAITLALHGSMRVKDLGDAEGYLLKELRNRFPGVPIYTSLDMHATMTAAMHHFTDGMVGYKTAPHTDCTETGIHAAELTHLALSGQVTTKTSWVKVPVLVAGEKSATNIQPMISLIKALQEAEAKEGILAASYLMGFPWADSQDAQIGVYVVTNNNQALADQTAADLAEYLWSKKEEFSFNAEAYDNQRAIQEAIKSVKEGKKPVYLSDSGDNPTAGAASDCTHLLEDLLKVKELETLGDSIIYGGFYDPEATKACQDMVGQTVTLSIGGKFDPHTSKPVEITGNVLSYQKNWSRNGFLAGDLAVLQVKNLRIVLAETHVGYTDPQMYRDLQLEPEKAGIIICKLGYLTPEHEKLAQRAILVLTKGNTNEDLESIPYQWVQRPMYPLDKGFSYNAWDYMMKKEGN
ncbi:Microcystin degradation protein MlrC, contains DUF1485 domain [Tindallia magadiensis]|uniref:Microcystin degradation protein MlrC, contains DUF1485 domain n=1 Tax=Tindallia magadiensis TaxID=69895 RepID=A0A1I3HMK3_9FIRM|nr:M81 family metallopeptidase [Tindallia magadiensis]SFI37008.1 Microcystin degradation protein MlrC, contains DUF1485 domain [Tindallia magadiensis]